MRVSASGVRRRRAPPGLSPTITPADPAAPSAPTRPGATRAGRTGGAGGPLPARAARAHRRGALDACADLPKVRRRLQLLVDLGLGYLALGETTTALSGGEAQRLKLSNDLGRDQHGTVFVLDEPSIGLHPLDVRVLPGYWTSSWKPGPRCSSSNTIST